MLNKEKYAKDLVEISINRTFALNKNTMKICPCDLKIKCEDCFFSRNNYPYKNIGGCSDNCKHWANRKYIEPKIFTEQEKDVLVACDKIEFVAKDNDGTVYGYVKKPKKGSTQWVSNREVICLSTFSSCDFKALSWEDVEPVSREEILRN